MYYRKKLKVIIYAVVIALTYKKFIKKLYKKKKKKRLSKINVASQFLSIQ